MPGTHVFSSKAQWRWAFATHKPWARRHAEATEVRGGFHALVPRKHAENAGRAVKAFLKPGS